MGKSVIIGGCNELGRLATSLMDGEIVVTSRSHARATEFAAEFDDTVTGEALDLTSDTQIEEFFGKHGALSSMIHLAVARRPVKPDLEYDLDDWVKELQINVGSAYKCAVEAAKLMEPGGSIILTGSIYGQVGVDHSIYPEGMLHSPITYAVSKAGVAHLVRELAISFAPRGIRVNCLSFGGVQGAQPPEFIERYEAKVPMKRMAQYGDLKEPMRFLLSSDNTYFTGQELMVDGGFTIW